MNNSLYVGKMIAGKSVQNWNASGTFFMAKIPWNVLTQGIFAIKNVPDAFQF